MPSGQPHGGRGGDAVHLHGAQPPDVPVLRGRALVYGAAADIARQAPRRSEGAAFYIKKGGFPLLYKHLNGAAANDY